MLDGEFWRSLWENLPEWLEFLAPGVVVTIELTVVVVAGALILGTAVALARSARSRLLRGLMIAYIETFRGVPGLVTLYVVYFSLPAIGIYFSSFAAAAIALTLTGGAYAAEIVRAGLVSVDAGQRDAGRVLGLQPIQTLLSIVFPQAFRVSLPALGALGVVQLQYTALASVIAAPELTNRGFEIGALTFRYMQIFLVVGVLYLLLTLPVFFIYRRTEYALAKGQAYA